MNRRYITRDPIDLFTATPESLTFEQKSAYIFILQRYLTQSSKSDHIRARIAQLSGEPLSTTSHQ